MALIGDSCGVLTHSNYNLDILKENFIEQGFTMSLNYNVSASANNNGRLIHRGQFILKHSFQINAVVSLPNAEAIFNEYQNYCQLLRAGLGAPSWQLFNNRMKSINSLSNLSFNTYQVTPVNMVYQPLDNNWAQLNVSLAEV